MIAFSQWIDARRVDMFTMLAKKPWDVESQIICFDTEESIIGPWQEFPPS